MGEKAHPEENAAAIVPQYDGSDCNDNSNTDSTAVEEVLSKRQSLSDIFTIVCLSPDRHLVAIQGDSMGSICAPRDKNTVTFSLSCCLDCLVHTKTAIKAD